MSNVSKITFKEILWGRSDHFLKDLWSHWTFFSEVAMKLEKLLRRRFWISKWKGNYHGPGTGTETRGPPQTAQNKKTHPRRRNRGPQIERRDDQESGPKHPAHLRKGWILRWRRGTLHPVHMPLPGVPREIHPAVCEYHNEMEDPECFSCKNYKGKKWGGLEKFPHFMFSITIWKVENAWTFH